MVNKPVKLFFCNTVSSFCLKFLVYIFLNKLIIYVECPSKTQYLEQWLSSIIKFIILKRKVSEANCGEDLGGCRKTANRFLLLQISMASAKACNNLATCK